MAQAMLGWITFKKMKEHEMCYLLKEMFFYDVSLNFSLMYERVSLVLPNTLVSLPFAYTFNCGLSFASLCHVSQRRHEMHPSFALATVRPVALSDKSHKQFQLATNHPCDYSARRPCITPLSDSACDIKNFEFWGQGSKFSLNLTFSRTWLPQFQKKNNAAIEISLCTTFSCTFFPLCKVILKTG